MSERLTVVCVPWFQRVRVLKSRRTSCDRCQREIAVSIRTLQATPENTRFICGACGKREAPEEEPKLLDATRAEIASLTGHDPGGEPGLRLGDFVDDLDESAFRAHRRSLSRRRDR